MSQQIPVVGGIPYTTESNLKRRLFVETGFGYKEIANNKGVIINYPDSGLTDINKIGRIVEDYVPPTPSVKTVEVKLARAPSAIHSTGKSSYNIELRIMFPSKLAFHDFIFYCNNTFKYYDERGGIYTCAMTDRPEVKRVEAGSRYDVKLVLIGIKKEADDTLELPKYTDIKMPYANTVNVVKGCVTPGLITITFPGLIDKVLNLDFTGDNLAKDVSYLTWYIYLSLNAPEYTSDLNISRVEDTKINVETINSANYGELQVDVGSTGADIRVEYGYHFATKDIMEIAQAGIVATRDRNGNLVTTYSPNNYTNRAEGVSMLNRLRKYVERMLRG